MNPISLFLKRFLHFLMSQHVSESHMSLHPRHQPNNFQMKTDRAADVDAVKPISGDLWEETPHLIEGLIANSPEKTNIKPEQDTLCSVSKGQAGTLMMCLLSVSAAIYF